MLTLIRYGENIDNQSIYTKIQLKSLTNTFESYKTDVETVSAYTSLINNFPHWDHLHHADWDTQTFRDEFVKAKVWASSWIKDGIYEKLNEIPAALVGYDDMYNLYRGDILSDISIIQDPNQSEESKKTAKKQLKEQLLNLKNGITTRKTAIAKMDESLDIFQNDCKKYTVFFEDAYKKSKDTALSDSNKLKQLEELRATVQKRIDYWNGIMIGMLVSECVEAVVVVVSLGFGPIGLLVSLIAGVGMIGEAIAMVAADEELKNAMAEMKKIKDEINEYTEDSDHLKEWIDRFKELDKHVGDVRAAIKNISFAWSEVVADIEKILVLLEQAYGEEEKAEYEKLKKSIEETQKPWKELVDLAKKLLLLKTTYEEDIYDVRIA